MQKKLLNRKVSCRLLYLVGLLTNEPFGLMLDKLMTILFRGQKLHGALARTTFFQLAVQVLAWVVDDGAAQALDYHSYL